MSVIWFIVAVIFFVLWLNQKSKQPNGSNGNDSYDYARGYWDGYRALCDDLVERVKTGIIDAPLLHALRDKSYAPDAHTDTSEGASKSLAERVTDEINTTPHTAPSMTAAVATQPQLTAEELQATAEKRTLRNLNILLYVGSFLIVAATALFVTLTMPAMVKLVGLILVTAAFYLSGLVLHATSTRLKPAALAFVGTGLAMIPFIGFALASLGGLSGANAWFITSLAGLAAYLIAAVRLQSEFIAYVTMAFVLSLALSAVSTLSLSIMWYFIVVIGVSLLCNSARILWPTAIPRTFTAPVEATGAASTPIAIVASLFVTDRMELYMYEVLFGITSAHYLVLWLEKRSFMYETVVRALLHVTLLIVAFDISSFSPMHADTVIAFGFWWLAFALVQAIYSLFRAPHATGMHNQLERVWVGGAMSSMICGLIFWTNNQAALLTVLSLSATGIVALGALLRWREAHWAYVTLGASIALPFLLGRGVAHPPVSYEVIALYFAALTPLMLIAYDRMASLGRSDAVKQVFLIAALCYGILITISGLLSYTTITIGWTTLLSAATLVVISYILRSYLLEICGALFGVASVVAWVYASPLASDWQAIAWMTGATALLVSIAALHHIRRESQRRDSLVSLAVGATGLLVFAPTPTTATTQTVAGILIAAGITGLVIRFLLTNTLTPLTMITRVAYGLFPFLGVIAAWRAGSGWITLALAVGAGIAWLASSREKLPALFAIGNTLLVTTLIAGWVWLDFDAKYWATHSIVWVASAVFYGLYWLMVDKKDQVRQTISFLSTVIMLSIGSLAGLYILPYQDLAIASVGTLLALAGVTAIHGYRQQQHGLIELAVYLATFGLQRFVAILIPDISLVFYAHWWALVIGLVATWRPQHRQIRAVIALSFVTLSTGLYALQYASGYTLLFLFEHAVVLVAGAMLRQQWMLWWGVTAVILAVLYFLRDYTFLALLFLGFLIILFVIWRLTKVAKK